MPCTVLTAVHEEAKYSALCVLTSVQRPRKLLTPCSGQGDTPDAAAGSSRCPKPGHTSGRDADPYQSSAQRALFQAPGVPSRQRTANKTIKKTDCRLVIGPLTCISWWRGGTLTRDFWVMSPA